MAYRVVNSPRLKDVQIASPYLKAVNGQAIPELWRIAITQSPGVEIFGPWIKAPVPQTEEELNQGLFKGIRDESNLSG